MPRLLLKATNPLEGSGLVDLDHFVVHSMLDHFNEVKKNKSKKSCGIVSFKRIEGVETQCTDFC